MASWRWPEALVQSPLVSFLKCQIGAHLFGSCREWWIIHLWNQNASEIISANYVFFFNFCTEGTCCFKLSPQLICCLDLKLSLSHNQWWADNSNSRGELLRATPPKLPHEAPWTKTRVIYFCDNLWFQFVKKLGIKDSLVLVYFKISRIKEPVVLVFSKSLKESAVFVKLAAKNWQLHKRYLMGS
jgi:hypothetical protein